MVEWERANSPLDSVQRALVSKTTIIKPDRRYDEIMRIIQQRNFSTDRYLNAMNVKVQTNEMMKVKGKSHRNESRGVKNMFDVNFSGRVLPPPLVKYRGQGNSEVAESVSVGKWSIRNRFYSTPPINKWAIVHFGPRPNDRILPILQEFEGELPNVRFSSSKANPRRNALLFQLLRQYGIFLNSAPIKTAKPPHPGEIETTLRDLKNQACQIAFVVLNDVQSDVYDCVKQCGNQKLGLVTQCVSFQSLQKNSGKLRMCKSFSSLSVGFRGMLSSFQMCKISVRRSTRRSEA